MKPHFLALGLILAPVAPFAAPAAAQQGEERAIEALSTSEKKAVVEAVSRQLLNNYVFPDTAVRMADAIQARLTGGAYRQLAEPQAFAARLTADLQQISNDKHLRVIFDPMMVADIRSFDANPGQGTQDEGMPDEFLTELRRGNFGFREARIMGGNVAYINLTDFVDTDLAGQTATAAMKYVSNADALIIDLRQNGGGSPSMIQLITSYLVGPAPVHLNSFYDRPSDTTTHVHTLASVDGRRRPDMDVYILTSSYTFSAAEEFAYNLRHMGRATIVGEVTGGGAHPGGELIATDRFLVWVPSGRAINPITGTNWEGTGVRPHIETSADAALNHAYGAALEKLVSRNSSPAGDFYRWHLQAVRANLAPVTLSETELAAYVGRYGPRTLILADGALYYQRQGRNRYRLIPIGEDTFMLDGMDNFRLQVIRQDGRIVGLRGLYENGQQDETPKDA